MEKIQFHLIVLKILIYILSPCIKVKTKMHINHSNCRQTRRQQVNKWSQFLMKPITVHSHTLTTMVRTCIVLTRSQIHPYLKKLHPLFCWLQLCKRKMATTPLQITDLSDVLQQRHKAPSSGINGQDKLSDDEGPFWKGAKRELWSH